MPLVLVPLVGFALLLAWLVLFGMHRSINDWLVPLLTRLAHPQGSFLTRAALKVVSLAAGGILWIVNQVDHAITKAASHATAAVAHWLNGIVAWITHLFSAAETFSLDTAHGFERLVTHTIPSEIHKATVPIWRGIDALEHDFTRLDNRFAVYARGIDRILAHRVLPAIRHLEHAVGVAIPRELGRIRAGERALERGIRNPSRAWIKRVWRAGWILVGAGLMLKFLTRKFPWLFCRNSTNALKAVCGWDSALLDALLLDATAIVGAISVVEFAEAMQEIEDEAVSILSTLIKEMP